MTAKVIPFNPLDKINLGASVGDALLKSPTHPLGTVPKFLGAGVYAIYYCGDFPAYKAIAELNQDRANPSMPIYVGKAIPEGGRKGASLDETTSTNALGKRLGEHAKSIQQATNLNLDDFVCRYLVVDDIWIPLGENLMIAKYSPLWNSLIDGFGNHDPGSGRHKGLVPRWDVLHPGRGWATKLQPRAETAEKISQDVIEHLRSKLTR